MKSIQRILAILGAAALFGLVILTLVLAVTGSSYFMASFYAMIVIPVFIYGYLIILRILSAKQKDRIRDILEEGGREGSDESENTGENTEEAAGDDPDGNTEEEVPEGEEKI